MKRPRNSVGAHRAAPSRLKKEIDAAASRGYRFYVYTLSDAQGVFYVGKGKGARVFQHERYQDNDSNSAKQERIALCAARTPDKAVVAYFRDEGAAYDHERTLIAQGADTLTNMASGQQSGYESAKAHARNILARAMSLEEWEASLTPARRAWLDSLWGCARTGYAKLLDMLRQQAENPTPTSITVFPDGSHKAAW